MRAAILLSALLSLTAGFVFFHHPHPVSRIGPVYAATPYHVTPYLGGINAFKQWKHFFWFGNGGNRRQGGSGTTTARPAGGAAQAGLSLASTVSVNFCCCFLPNWS